MAEFGYFLVATLPRATVFRTNRSQAIRIPKAVAFPDDVKELVAIREGRGLLLVPPDDVWTSFFARPGVEIEEPEDPIDETPPASFD